MGDVKARPGLAMAKVVVDIMSTLMSEEDEDLYYTGFSGNKTSGLQLISEDTGRRCTIINVPISDGIRLVYGDRNKFDLSTGAAKDSASWVDYDYDDYSVVAKNARAWLLGAVVPTPTADV